MASRKRPARAEHSPSLAPTVAVAGIIAGTVLLLLWNLPGPILTWLMFAVAGWLHPRAELTGKKDGNGYATAAHSGEESNLRRFRFWNDLKWRMFTPNMDWWFGWPVFASSLLAVVLATFAWRMDHLLGPISAAVAYITVTQVASARRRNSPLGAPCPGTRVGPIKSAAEHIVPAGWRLLAGAAGGAALGFGILYVPFVELSAIDRGLIAVGGALIAVMPWWSDISLAHWREIVAARKEWEPRWEMLKQSPAPYLLSRDHIGEVQVDTFDAPAASGAIAFYPMGPKLVPTIGTNTRLYVLPTEDLDEDDQPITGTKHPLRFRVVTMTSDGMPDLTDPELPEEQARIALECGVVGTLMEMGAAAPIIGTIKSVVDTSEPDLDLDEEDEDAEDGDEVGVPGGSSAGRAAPSPGAAWMVQIMVPQGPPLKWMHNDAEGAISGALGCEVVVDWRTYEAMFVGVLRHPNQRFVDITGAAPAGKRAKDLATNIHRMDVEQEWRGRWEGVLKTNVNFPAIEHDQYFEHPLADGTIIYSQSFVTLKGDDLSQYFGTEAKLATALEHMPFVAVTGFLTRGQRRGERHPQAFTVLWSSGNLPANPEKLRPGRKEGGSQAVAELSLLKGRVSEGFKAARLAQPEVFDAKCMTGSRSRGQIWKISIRLYGGVTLADVRGAAQRIKQSWGCSWLRVTEPPNGDGVVIVAGVEPAKSTPADETVLPYLVGLDWEQAWLDAKISGVGGLTPKLRNVETLPDNEIVQVLDFDLPSGLALSDVRSAKFKLQSTTSNAFIEIRPHPDKNPSRIQVYAATESPMPALIPFNFGHLDKSPKGYPFATGIEGKPIELNVRNDSHLLVLGSSGSGKSVTAQGLMYGAVLSGADVVMIDVQKQGADFKFAEEQCVAFIQDLESAEATMKALYAEVQRRARLNGQHGVSHSSELPEAPPTIIIFIDEFLGLIMAGKRPQTQPEDNAELEKQRLAKVKDYNAKKQIGFLTGRIAAEARSADVHLVLMTQKLTASSLDDDLRDLKDLSLDTRIPVPVSDRFPTGWALNRDLEVGDLLYAQSGETTPVIGFSEVFEDNDLYEVTFDDGQVVKAGAGHLWQVSSGNTRRLGPGKNPIRESNVRDLEVAQALADAFEQHDEYLSARTLEAIAGVHSADLGHAHIVMPDGEVLAGRWGVADEFEVESAIQTMSAARSYRDVEALQKFRGQWLRTVELVHLTDRDASAHRSAYLARLLRADGVPERPSARENVYSAAQATTRGAAKIRRAVGVDPWTGSLLGPERVLTTAEIAADAKRRWAVTNAEAIDSSDIDLPVDPYVLGAWLGDGSTGSGIFASGAAETCMNPGGESDRELLIAKIQSAGYGAHELRCGENLVGTTGLMVNIRAAGVLNDKHIPATYLRASYSQRLALLQGLMDTDGSASKVGQCTIGLTRKSLADGVYELATSLGIKVFRTEWDARYVTETGERKVTGRVFNLSFRTNLSVFTLPRKVQRQAAPGPNSQVSRRVIVDVRKVESEPTRCIAVAHPSHLFLVENFVPTHNTNLARIIIGKSTFGDRMSALRDPENSPDLGEVVPKGRGIWESTVDAPQQVQFWYATASEYANELSARIPPVAPERLLDYSSFITLEDPSTSAVFGERIEPTSAPIIRPTTDVDLGTLDFDLSDDDGEEVDLSARGIQIIGLDDDEPDTDDSADTVEQDDEAEDLDWGDLSAAPVAEDLDWGDPEPAPVAEPAAETVPATGFDWSEPETAGPADADDDVLDMEATELPHVDDDGSMYGWGLLDALVEHLSANPHIRTVRWHDEVLLSPFADSGLSYAQMLAEVVESLDASFDGPTAPDPTEAAEPFAPEPFMPEPAEVPVLDDITWDEPEQATDQFEADPFEAGPFEAQQVETASFAAPVPPPIPEPAPAPIEEPVDAQEPAAAPTDGLAEGLSEDPEPASPKAPAKAHVDDRPMRTPVTAPDQFSDF